MTKEQLLEAAQAELNQIKEHATQEEIATLVRNIDMLDGTRSHTCVYGLLTGMCWCPRATELIRLCAVAPFHGSLGTFSCGNDQLEVDDETNLRRVYTNVERALVVYWYETAYIVKKTFNILASDTTVA